MAIVLAPELKGDTAAINQAVSDCKVSLALVRTMRLYSAPSAMSQLISGEPITKN